jgi:membrane-bound lytic murein transglycosylase D
LSIDSLRRLGPLPILAMALLAACATRPLPAPVPAASTPLVSLARPEPAPLTPAAIPSAQTVAPAPAAPAAAAERLVPLAKPDVKSGLQADTGATRYGDLFERMRAGFLLDVDNRAAIDVELNWFANHPDYLERTFGRSSLYLYHIVAEVERRGMPLEIALLPVVESAFEPYAYSRAAASGLWQFIPDTGSRHGLKQNWWYDGRRDVIESTRAALDYLQEMHDEFNGDWLLAIAGYNCGEKCIEHAIAVNQAAGLPIDFWSLRLPAETRTYVPKLLAMRQLVANPADFGISISHIANEPYFKQVDTGGQIDLKIAAELAGVTYEELYELNPAYHRWATDPSGPDTLLLPCDAAEVFRRNLALLSPDERMRVAHYRVQRGDTLATVAKRFKTQPAVLRELNTLGANGPLVVGSELRVPSAASALPAKAALAAARFDSPPVLRKSRRPVIHIVRAGDNLYAIARRHRMDVHKLASLNGMQPGDSVYTGQHLVVKRFEGRYEPASSPPPASARPQAPVAHASSPPRTAALHAAARPVSYTVRRGDTLSRIARMFQVTIRQIMSWNGMPTEAALKTGQRLTINVHSGKDPA